MSYKKKNKKGVSPIVATVLLIAIVIVIALIIFLWFRSMTREACTKFGQNVELVCEDVNFRATYSGGSLQIVNDGTVPIQGFKIKKIGRGEHITEDLVGSGLKQGGAGEYPLGDISSYTEAVIIPVLLAGCESGETTYVCDERHGVEVSIS